MEVLEYSQEEMRVTNRNPRFVNNRLTEFLLLLGRSWRQTRRDKVPIIITMVQVCGGRGGHARGVELPRAARPRTHTRLPPRPPPAPPQTVIIGFFLAALYSQMPMDQVGIQDEIGM